MINFLLPEKDTEDIMNKFIYFQKGDHVLRAPSCHEVLRLHWEEHPAILGINSLALLLIIQVPSSLSYSPF